MKTFECHVARKGYYAGAVFCIQKQTPESENKAADPQEELEKLHKAEDALKESIMNSSASEKAAEIRETVLAILTDAMFTEKMESYIKDQSYEAASAALRAGEDIADEFSKIDNEYIRSRQDDVRGVADKLAAIIRGEADGPKTYSAISATEISPAHLSSIPEDMIGGMVTYKGSPDSHAAILAGSIGIPYLYGNSEAVDEAEKASFIIIDSESGTVTTDPDEETKKSAMKRMEEVLKKKTEEGTKEAYTVAAVADGELIPMAEIPDPVFAEGMMGECFGIMPANGNVYAPVSGVVSNIAETGHAITITSEDGNNLLIHVGIDTVNLGSKAFRHYVKEGDHVESNQPVMEADLEMIKAAGLSPMIIVIRLQ